MHQLELSWLHLFMALTQNVSFSFQRIGWAESTCHHKTESVTQHDKVEQVQVIKHKAEAAYPNPLGLVDDPTHEGKQLEATTQDAFGITPAHLVCSDLVCHGSTMTVFLGVLILVGIFVGKKMINRRSRMLRHSRSELELPSLHLDYEDDAVDTLMQCRNRSLQRQNEKNGFLEEQ